MNSNGERFSRRWIACAMGAALLGVQGCSFEPSKKSKEKAAAAQSKSNENPAESGFNGGKYCVETMAQTRPGPARPIHFSYKVNESDGSAKDFEADLAGDSFDQTIHQRWPATEIDHELNSVPGATPTSFRDGFAESTRTNHYTRADASGWTAGWGSTEQGGTPWSLFILKPTTTRVGIENIGGYDTIKYAVDTSGQSQLEKFPGNTGFAVKDYNITGSAWVAKDTGCVLQYNIDLEKDGKDGKVSKTHYEGTVTKQ